MTAAGGLIQYPLLAFGSRATAVWRVGVGAGGIEPITPTTYRMFSPTFELCSSFS